MRHPSLFAASMLPPPRYPFLGLAVPGTVRTLQVRGRCLESQAQSHEGFRKGEIQGNTQVGIRLTGNRHPFHELSGAELGVASFCEAAARFTAQGLAKRLSPEDQMPVRTQARIDEVSRRPGHLVRT